ncbi:MAG: hypothetical protein B6D35_13740 [Candidatus Brocadia sp. UTAMX2]|jgi:flagellar motor protein MotB|nr:MAG: hypothetical protein B6D35_13740 [Candidatus Brocadia sp. UTAMX2]
MSDEGGSSGGHGGPVWLLTYCDLITLLVAFFVMMISFSTINVDKYKEDIPKIEESFDSECWSERFTGVFEEGLQTKGEGYSGGKTGESLLTGGKKPLETFFEKELEEERRFEEEDQHEENFVDPEEMYNFLSGFTKRGGLAKGIDIEDVKIGCRIKIPTDLCFKKGESALTGQAYDIFDVLGTALRTMRGKIVVATNAGKTLQQGREFLSDVSVDRAANICDLLAMRENIEPKRIAISRHYSADTAEENMIAIMIFKK